jgi:hypothetical protein
MQINIYTILLGALIGMIAGLAVSFATIEPGSGIMFITVRSVIIMVLAALMAAFIARVLLSVVLAVIDIMRASSVFNPGKKAGRRP